LLHGCVLESGSEAYRLIKESGCGFVKEPGDYTGIIHQLEEIIQMNRYDLTKKGIRSYLDLNKYKNLLSQISS
jgi:colanic acid biosynthesis glycosyl transferase WcaI